MYETRTYWETCPGSLYEGLPVWTCLPFIRSGQNLLARHGERGKEDKADGRRGREDNIREQTGLDFAKSQRAVKNREKI